ncbi:MULTISPECIES: phage tail protein [Bacillus cereus group]|uniref:phage tail protein n=1 Tax=Bacillus cereus group TaxID=86661 RepID=UPI0002790129|nr:phage tail protein [Bacillus paranthracis]EJQ03681.1 phage minor structural protein [Bacillus cereus AND1407]KMP84698.1 phage minor structural protein [Bacillus cereus]KMQ12343.1 phage minor structural protein [Bacillus cereus]MCC2358948.1 phage tail protein [Bacillus paranthracis]MCU5368404.1 phage tail protein [Bacillus paranthracis]
MLVVKGINQQEEMLTDYKEVKRKRRVNGEHSLSFYLLNTPNVSHAYHLVDKRASIMDKSDEYIALGINKRGHYGKLITAPHIFFDDMMDHQYNLYNGYANFKQCMDFIFNGTGWKYVNQGAFAATKFENFGDDTRSALLQTALNRYEAEMEINYSSKTVIFKNQIGKETDAQFRYGHNLKTFEEDTDMSNFATVIRGYGKDHNDKEIMVEYVSPMAKIYGRIHQKPIRDERFKSKETLLEKCKKEINDVPDTRFKVSIVSLIENGLSPLHKFDLGDYVYMLYEEADVKVKIRVIEIEDDPTDPTKAPIVELSTFKELKTASSVQAQFKQTQKQVQQLMDDGGNLNLALKRLYRNSNHYSDHTGDWYISPDDPNAYVHIGAGGLDVHRGLVRVEREDGYATIIGGILQHGFDINGHEPPFTAVNVEGWWWVTDKSDEHYDCQYYTFEHKSRYLNVLIGQLATEGASCEVAIMAGDGNTFLAKYASNNSDSKSPIAVYGKLYEIDLGVPTGEEMSVYIRLRSTVEGKKAYCRKIRMWLDR